MAENSPPAIAPPDLQQILTELADSDRRASEMVRALSNDQLNWRPSATGWSIAQCLDHLAITNSVYSAALHRAIEQAHQEPVSAPISLRPGVFGRAFIRSLEPPPTKKHRAPGKIVPCDRIDKDEVLRKFLESEEAMRAVIRDGARLDMNRIRFKTPFFWFLRFSVGTGLLIITAHNRRHLWQAQAIIDNPSFPR